MLVIDSPRKRQSFLIALVSMCQVALGDECIAKITQAHRLAVFVVNGAIDGQSFFIHLLPALTERHDVTHINEYGRDAPLISNLTKTGDRLLVLLKCRSGFALAVQYRRFISQ